MARRSDVELFGACPFRWDRTVHHGLDDSNPFAIRGRMFHAVQAEYLTRLIVLEAGRVAALKGAPDTGYPVNCDAEEARAALLTVAPLFADGMVVFDEVRDIFLRFAEKYRARLDHIVAIEELVTWRDRSCTIDLVEAEPDELEIFDWKTFYRGFTEDEAKTNFQAQWYTALARRRWPGFLRYRFTFMFVRFGATRRSVTYTQAELDDVDEKLDVLDAAIGRAVKTGNYPAVAGPHCRTCSLKCPFADQPVKAPVRFRNQKQAEAAARKKLALIRQLELIDAALIGYTDAHGPVTAGGYAWGHKLETRSGFPLGPVLAVLEAHGHAAPALKLSRSSLATYLKTKKNREVGVDLERLAESTPLWTFKKTALSTDAEDPPTFEDAARALGLID